MTTLVFHDTMIRIAHGEWVGYMIQGQEFIHQKESPGWGHSDTEMFPVIGPTAGTDYRVATPRGVALQDQHGILRDLTYRVESRSDDSITYRKDYRANTRVKNSKFPDRSPLPELYWPYDFTFRKTFALAHYGLDITFEVQAEAGMPYMLGYHPAFALHTPDPVVEGGGKRISIAKVMALGHRALEVPDSRSVVLHDLGSTRLTTEGFKGFMLWTEVPNMVCIEPITHYPYGKRPIASGQGFNLSDGQPATFKLRITHE